MHRTLRIAVAVTALSLFAAACGSTKSEDTGTVATDPGKTRTVEIEMRDISYSVKSVDVAKGEAVRFVFTNAGAVKHDAFIGDEAAQADHEMEMNDADMGGMGGNDGDEMTAITVEPGKTGELTHTFDSTSKVLIGCHEPGHYAAGMKLTINIS